MAQSGDAALDPDEQHRLEGLAGATLQGPIEGRGLRIGVACARFNGAITTRLLTGCLGSLAASGVDQGDVTVVWVPGAFELPSAARALAGAEAGCDAVVCLGAVIRGETDHYDLVAGACANGIAQVALSSGLPVIFGVLATDTIDQALARSEDDETNKGIEAATAAVEMARLLEDRRLR
jgi:6,7-dimethyl-8-ribityllumazine synthase